VFVITVTRNRVLFKVELLWAPQEVFCCMIACAMYQNVTLRPLLLQFWVTSQVNQRGICGRQSGCGTTFLQAFQFSQCFIHTYHQKLIQKSYWRCSTRRSCVTPLQQLVTNYILHPWRHSLLKHSNRSFRKDTEQIFTYINFAIVSFRHISIGKAVSWALRILLETCRALPLNRKVQVKLPLFLIN
jgi:hypothetical protein